MSNLPLALRPETLTTHHELSTPLTAKRDNIVWFMNHYNYHYYMEYLQYSMEDDLEIDSSPKFCEVDWNLSPVVSLVREVMISQGYEVINNNSQRLLITGNKIDSNEGDAIGIYSYKNNVVAVMNMSFINDLLVSNTATTLLGDNIYEDDSHCCPFINVLAHEICHSLQDLTGNRYLADMEVGYGDRKTEKEARMVAEFISHIEFDGNRIKEECWDVFGEDRIIPEANIQETIVGLFMNIDETIEV